MIQIYENICKGCGICIEFCPLKVLEKSKEMNKRGYYPPKLRDAEKCTGCRICELMCPDFAIAVIKARQLNQVESHQLESLESKMKG